jgi:hypothetical protein
VALWCTAGLRLVPEASMLVRVVDTTLRTELQPTRRSTPDSEPLCKLDKDKYKAPMASGKLKKT